MIYFLSASVLLCVNYQIIFCGEYSCFIGDYIGLRFYLAVLDKGNIKVLISTVNQDKTTYTAQRGTLK